MLKKRIYLSPPHMSGGEMKYIEQAFAENWIAPLGPNVDAFEDNLASYCGVKHAAALSSGTAAIHLALIILGIQPGDEVIASTFTFSATVNPIVYLGANPILIDSEEDTWNMDPELLRSTIEDRLKKGKKPKAIIPVHLYGMPAKMDQIIAIAREYEIPIIEDAAEALGSKYADKYAGSMGDIGILSFNGNKMINTSGGGALISDNAAFVEKARFLATQAREKEVYYQHEEIGYNYRMSNIIAGIGRGQMEVASERVSARRRNHDFYAHYLNDIDGVQVFESMDKKHFSNYWLTTILLDPGITGVDNFTLLRKLDSYNIEARPLWKPMHMQPVFSKVPAYVNGTSESLFNLGLCLPSGSSLSEEDLDIIVHYIKKIVKSG